MTDKNHWQLMLAEQYQSPTIPTVTRIQRLWLRMLRILGVEDESPQVNHNDNLAEHDQLDSPQAQAALREYFSTAELQQQINFLLDPPFSETAAMARTWAWQQGRTLLTPPSLEQLEKVAVDEWWQQQTHHNGAWLIDDLARYFLRSTMGLRFIRALLPRLLEGEFGAGLIVCDSWAFAFLRHSWPLSLPNVHCFSPANPALLRQLGIKESDRQLLRLAGESRGNAGIAWVLWQCKAQPDHQPLELPVSANEHMAFILYSLLLHRGLSSILLQKVLPTLAEDELKTQLVRLSHLGIIEHKQPYWRLTATAYLTVRDFLSERDYLLDDF